MPALPRYLAKVDRYPFLRELVAHFQDSEPQLSRDFERFFVDLIRDEDRTVAEIHDLRVANEDLEDRLVEP